MRYLLVVLNLYLLCIAVTAQSERVSAMPTFLFFHNKTRVDMLKGANPQELAAKVEKWSETLGTDASASAVPGQVRCYFTVDPCGSTLDRFGIGELAQPTGQVKN